MPAQALSLKRRKHNAASGFARVLLLALPPLLGSASCGLNAPTPPASRFVETGIDGQPLSLDDLKAIAADGDLTEDQKRDRFFELGIEDPDLIDALLDF